MRSAPKSGGQFSVGAAIPLRADFKSEELKRLAKSRPHANRPGRLLALTTIYEGTARRDAIKLLHGATRYRSIP
jgi:hypothetical protein